MISHQAIFSLVYFVTFIKFSLQAGYPYDRIQFFVSGNHDPNKLHLAGIENGNKVFVARLTTETGDQIVGSYIPEQGDRVFYAQDNTMKSVQSNEKRYKVEFLQHSTNGGISWLYTHKKFDEDAGRRLNLTMSIGRLSTGERVFPCRGFIEEGRVDLLLLGRHIENREGCIVHGSGRHQLILDHFEVMGINYLGMHRNNKRFFGSTVAYCNKWSNCFS